MKIFKILYILVLWAKVALALEGLTENDMHMEALIMVEQFEMRNIDVLSHFPCICNILVHLEHEYDLTK